MNDVWGEELLMRLACQALADAWDLDRNRTPTFQQWAAKASARLRSNLARFYPDARLEEEKLQDWLIAAFARKSKE